MDATIRRCRLPVLDKCQRQDRPTPTAARNLDFSRGVAASPLRIDDLEPLAVYQTEDPEVIIVELVTYGTLTGTGRTLAGTSIQVFRVRDGKIVLFRDYFNPLGFEELLRD